MTTYDISGNIVIIHNDVENERYLRTTTDEYINSVKECFDSWYSAQGNCYAIEKEADNLYNDSIGPLIEKGIDILGAQGVYSLDGKAFYDKYVQKYCSTINTYCAINDMLEEINAVNIRQGEEEMYRRARKAGRGRVIGGGFGFGGAIKGMAQAGVMNAATGIAHSAVNVVGNIGSSIVASSDKSAIFKKYREPLKMALIQDLYDIRNALRIALKEEANIICKLPESDKANAIWNNYRLDRIPAEKKKEQIIEALMLDPYNLEIYRSIWEDYGDENGELRKMSLHFCVPLEQQIEEVAEQYGNNLFIQNCGLYEEAFDKKAVAIQIEDQIRETLDDLIQYCKKRTISENNISQIAHCRQLLEEIDKEVRTVRGVIYDTRELAENIRKDFCTFYCALQEKDIFENGTYEYVKSIDYSTEEFKSILESLFETECRLRSPERIYENIDFIVRQSLSSKLIGDGWIDIPDYMGSFSTKEPMICTLTRISGEELMLVLFDRSSKGKSGILITNRFFRIYAKGIFSSENLAYPIEQIEKIKCQGNDQYVITIYGQEPIIFAMKRSDMTTDDQIAFGNMLSNLVQMVNNLSSKHRSQLFRIIKHTKVCQCGMYLLANERICPSCKWMIKDSGEFVETQICPNCKNYIQIGKKFCSICGYHLDGSGDASNVSKSREMQSNIDVKVSSENSQETVAEFACPNCHSIIKAGKKFCSKCGAKVQ